MPLSLLPYVESNENQVDDMLDSSMPRSSVMFTLMMRSSRQDPSLFSAACLQRLMNDARLSNKSLTE